MRDLSCEAIRIEIDTPHTFAKASNFSASAHREVDANPDGIEFMGPMFETMRSPACSRGRPHATPMARRCAGADAAVSRTSQSAMGHIWQVTPTNTREDQIACGRDWVRVNLAATELGIGMQPLSQALQEYPEMAGIYAEIHRRLAPDGGTVQMWARWATGPRYGATPRWPLEAKIVGNRLTART
jgi:hypothetical protein